MNLRRRFKNVNRFVLVGITLLICQFTNGREPPKDRTNLWKVSERNQDMLLRYLRAVLIARGGVGRLYVHSRCLWDSENLLCFPRVELQPGSKGKAGLAAIRDVLAKNKGVTVAERQRGLTAIWIGGVSDDLLRTRIHLLRLEPLQRYNYLKAIEAIINTREIQTKMRNLRMEIPPIFGNYQLLEPDRNLRHLPTFMTNVTMDEALDLVAQVFGGLVIYEECMGQNRTRLFSVDFAPLAASTGQ